MNNKEKANVFWGGFYVLVFSFITGYLVGVYFNFLQTVIIYCGLLLLYLSVTLGDPK